MNLIKQCALILVNSILVMSICLTIVLPIKEAYSATANIPIFVDNVPTYSEVSSFYSNNNLLVPIRLISEELGAIVDWNGKQVTIKGQGVNIVLYMGKNEASVNGISKKLAAPPQIIQGRLFVPLRFIGEGLNAKVVYRDQKVFLYSPYYDGLLANKTGIFKHNDKILFVDNGSIKVKQNETENHVTLPIANKVDAVLAISNSGIVYASEPDIMYYNFSTQKCSKLFVNQGKAYRYTSFGSNGSFYVVDDSISTKSHNKSGNTPAEYYNAIFSVDIDGTNKKEVFVEQANYDLYSLKEHNGWIYYITMVPVITSYGIDHYTGSLNRVREDGTNKQQLTDNYLDKYYFTDEGIYYEYGYDRGSGILRYDELDKEA